MTLQEIREAYGEILRAYNDLFRAPFQINSNREEMIETVNFGDIEFLEKFRKEGKEILAKLKEAADQSGNPVIWHRGDPVAGLNAKIKERIERALKFGI
jgi:hypothetical protein